MLWRQANLEIIVISGSITKIADESNKDVEGIALFYNIRSVFQVIILFHRYCINQVFTDCDL